MYISTECTQQIATHLPAQTAVRQPTHVLCIDSNTCIHVHILVMNDNIISTSTMSSVFIIFCIIPCRNWHTTSLRLRISIIVMNNSMTNTCLFCFNVLHYSYLIHIMHTSVYYGQPNLHVLCERLLLSASQAKMLLLYLGHVYIHVDKNQLLLYMYNHVDNVWLTGCLSNTHTHIQVCRRSTPSSTLISHTTRSLMYVALRNFGHVELYLFSS